MGTKEIIRFHAVAYSKASISKKTAIIDGIVAATNMNRKSVIRALKREYLADGRRDLSTKRHGRPPRYIGEVDVALATLWQAYGYPCGERLYSELTEAIRIFKRDGMWQYADQTTELLLEMSLSTLRRKVIKLAKKRGLARGISSTKSANALKQLVPTFKGNYAGKGLGYGELDTVVHCGSKLVGVSAYSLVYVDMATYWTEPVAQYNKTDLATLHSIQQVAKRLPWRIKGLHPDSGSEFINQKLIAYCKRYGIELTRSRPSKKNDNCHVEERNNHVIRKYTGYNRYDHPEVVAVLNELYEAVRLYVNFFQPVFKVTRTFSYENEAGIKTKRHGKKSYDIMTPYARAMALPSLPLRTKLSLKEQYEKLNPVKLHDKIEVLQAKVSKLQQQLGYHYDVNLKPDR